MSFLGTVAEYQLLEHKLSANVKKDWKQSASVQEYHNIKPGALQHLGRTENSVCQEYFTSMQGMRDLGCTQMFWTDQFWSWDTWDSQANEDVIVVLGCDTVSVSR
jgi:hypothetical protein